MTTDPAPPSARSSAERLEALRRRRADGGTTAPLPVDRRRPTRRRHAAAGARVLVVGLSTSTAVALMGAMARAASPDTATAPTDRVVVGGRSATNARVATALPLVADPPTVSPTRAAPITTSQASPTP